MKNSFHKVIVRLLIVVVLAMVWALYLRGWKFGNLDSFADLVLCQGKYILMVVGVVGLFFAKTKYI